MTSADEEDPRKDGIGRHIRSHARGLLAVGIASVIGILASFLFQVVAARYLGAADFGLFSAFLAIVNVAAVGSAALQNLITVQTADSIRTGSAARSRRRWPIEAIVLGTAGGAAVALLAPVLAGSLDTTLTVVLAAAVTIPLSFVFADALGLLQGTGDVARAVWWTTISQVARIVAIIAAIAIGGGLAGVVGAVLVAMVIALVGALWSARRVARPSKGVFSTTGATIIVLTIAFAWLTNADVFLLRVSAPADIAGNYAAAAVLVKAGFLLPSTLALYLLPRFTRNRDNVALTRVGVYASLGVSLLTGLAMTLAFLILGTWIVRFLYGPSYTLAAEILVPLSIAYIPWIAAQGMLIKMTSVASKTAAAALLVAVGCQWIAFQATIPDIGAMLIALGAIGAAVLVTFLVIEWWRGRAPSPSSAMEHL